MGIVGCGLIGRKRAQSLGAGKLVACSDAVLDRAQALAAEHGAQAVADWREMVTRPEVQMVVVATTHDGLAPVTLAAVEAGKHVLVEKPAARRASELAAVIEAARSRGVLVRVGFDHRYHPALRKAHEMFVAGAVGPLMYLRARYGHGGRVGYQKEWRARPEVSGGGELIDQGMHLIDLARWFAGEFVQVNRLAGNWFWDMPVEDNAFLLLRTAEKKVAFMHCSCSEWKNLFSFESIRMPITHISVRGARQHNLRDIKCAHPAQHLHGGHRPLGLGQELACLRYDLCRGTAPLRGDALGLRAPVP